MIYEVFRVVLFSKSPKRMTDQGQNSRLNYPRIWP